MPEDHANFSVAIVDDEPHLLTMYQQLLKRREIPVSFVANGGHAALEKFRKAKPRPSIVIIDYRMPDMNGIELMGEILRMAPGTKIIFISADESVRWETLRNGASAFLRKPVGIKEITESINIVNRH